jgi:hypothetical protein
VTKFEHDNNWVVMNSGAGHTPADDVVAAPTAAAALQRSIAMVGSAAGPSQVGPLAAYPDYALVDPTDRWRRINSWAAGDSRAAAADEGAGVQGGGAHDGDLGPSQLDSLQQEVMSVSASLAELEASRARRSAPGTPATPMPPPAFVTPVLHPATAARGAQGATTGAARRGGEAQDGGHASRPHLPPRPPLHPVRAPGAAPASGRAAVDAPATIASAVRAHSTAPVGPQQGGAPTELQRSVDQLLALLDQSTAPPTNSHAIASVGGGDGAGCAPTWMAAQEHHPSATALSPSQLVARSLGDTRGANSGHVNGVTAIGEGDRLVALGSDGGAAMAVAEASQPTAIPDPQEGPQWPLPCPSGVLLAAENHTVGQDPGQAHIVAAAQPVFSAAAAPSSRPRGMAAATLPPRPLPALPRTAAGTATHVSTANAAGGGVGGAAVVAVLEEALGAVQADAARDAEAARAREAAVEAALASERARVAQLEAAVAAGAARHGAAAEAEAHAQQALAACQKARRIVKCAGCPICLCANLRLCR